MISSANCCQVSFLPSGSEFWSLEPQAVNKPPQRLVAVWNGDFPASYTATLPPASQPKTTTSTSSSHLDGTDGFEEAAKAGDATAEAPATAAAPKKERREIFCVMTYSPFILILKVWQSLHSRRGLPLTL